MDDYCPKGGFKAEHGLALLLEEHGNKVLLDTGQSAAFLENAKTLNINLSDLSAIVLSHGHYDHGGGLKSLLQGLGSAAPALYTGEGVEIHRAAFREGKRRDIGLEQPFPPLNIKCVSVSSPLEIKPGLWVLPKAERFDGVLPDPDMFKTINGKDIVDDFSDEISIVVIEDDGLSVISGCAHRGITNIAKAAISTFPGSELKSLIGGFHFVNQSSKRLMGLAAEIAKLKPKEILCCHCTGLNGYAALKAVVGDKIRVHWLHCGERLSI